MPADAPMSGPQPMDARAIDVLGYVAPAMELIYERGTPEFRGQWPGIERRLRLTSPTPGVGDWTSAYLRLPAGQLPGADLEPAALPVDGATLPGLEAGVLHDNSAGRLRALDALGIDVQLIGPAAGIDAAAELPSNLAVGILGAFNRYLVTYCERDSRRLRAVIQVHGAEAQWSAREVRELASHPAVAAVTVHLPVKVAPDTRGFAQIWEALAETGLPWHHRPSATSRVWTPAHVLGFMVRTGLLDRYPDVRVGFVEADGAALDALVAMAADEHGLPPGRAFVGIDTGDLPRVHERAAGALGGGTMWQSRFPFVARRWSGDPPLGRFAPAAYEGARRYLAGRVAVDAVEALAVST